MNLYLSAAADDTEGVSWTASDLPAKNGQIEMLLGHLVTDSPGGARCIIREVKWMEGGTLKTQKFTDKEATVGLWVPGITEVTFAMHVWSAVAEAICVIRED